MNIEAYAVITVTAQAVTSNGEQWIGHGGCYLTRLPLIEYTVRPGDRVTFYVDGPRLLGYPLRAIRINDGPLVAYPVESEPTA